MQAIAAFMAGLVLYSALNLCFCDTLCKTQYKLFSLWDAYTVYIVRPTLTQKMLRRINLGVAGLVWT
jgi:hypothetical protein